MHKFKTTSGQVVDVNGTSYNKAVELGWKEVKEAKKEAKSKANKRGNSTDSN